MFRLCAWMTYFGVALIGRPLPLQAHDLWLIAPEKVAVGQAITVRAVSGMAFPEGDHAPDPAAFVRRVSFLPNGREEPVEAVGRGDKAGLIRFTPVTQGIHIIAVETAPKVLALDAPAFNEYLVTDGLPHIYRLRSKENSLDRPSRGSAIRRLRKRSWRSVTPTTAIRVASSD